MHHSQSQGTKGTLVWSGMSNERQCGDHLQWFRENQAGLGMKIADQRVSDSRLVDRATGASFLLLASHWEISWRRHLTWSKCANWEGQFQWCSSGKLAIGLDIPLCFFSTGVWSEGVVPSNLRAALTQRFKARSARWTSSKSRSEWWCPRRGTNWRWDPIGARNSLEYFVLRSRSLLVKPLVNRSFTLETVVKHLGMAVGARAQCWALWAGEGWRIQSHSNRQEPD